MLGGHDDRVDTHRSAVFVREGHLSLTVGTQPVNDALLTNVSQALGEAVCQPNGGGHQVWCVGRGVAEHDALVARAEAVARVAATGDVGALAVQ